MYNDPHVTLRPGTSRLRRSEKRSSLRSCDELGGTPMSPESTVVRSLLDLPADSLPPRMSSRSLLRDRPSTLRPLAGRGGERPELVPVEVAEVLREARLGPTSEGS